MNIKQKVGLTAVLLLLLAGSVVVWAQSSASYDLRWHVIGGGGGVSNSASYSMNGTAGQSAASPSLAVGSSYTVSSGYWQGYTAIYLPVIQK
ncbi:MAG: hypothetical protein KJ069_20815 [Anaerolineae bacterium]|nr:hypothetical protein [Anaerolineae bacterium]